MASPHTLGDPLRAHDLAFYNWVGNLRVDYGDMGGKLTTARDNHPILRTYSGRTRLVADVTKLLLTMRWIDGATAAEMKVNAKKNFAVLPLPLATLQRTVDPTPDLENAGVPKLFRTGALDPATQMYEQHRWPGVYLTNYTLTLWSKKKYTMAFMKEWVLSQMGSRGAGLTETFISVEHPEPFGVQQQSLRFESMSDLSDIEGDDPNFRRVDISFMLRTLLFYPLIGSGAGRAEYLDTVGWDVALASSRDGLDFDPDSYAADIPRSDVRSANLFTFYRPTDSIPTTWGKTGTNAAVERAVIVPEGVARGDGLRVRVTDASDEVDLVSRPLTLDPSGRALMAVSLQYKSDTASHLLFSQRPGTNETPDWTTARQLTLPATSVWATLHAFTLLTDPVTSVTVQGSGAAADVNLAEIDVRHIRAGTTIAPSSSTPGGGETVYAWTGLAPEKPHLLVVVLAPQLTAVARTVSWKDDATTPGFTAVQQVAENQIGAVGLIQPTSDSLSLTVPDELSVVEVYAQRYDVPDGMSAQ